MSRSIARTLEHLRDLLVTAFSRHLDQLAIVQPVPLGIRAGVEQQPHGLDMSLARRKMHGRRVPVSGSSETRIALEQSPHVATSPVDAATMVSHVSRPSADSSSTGLNQRAPPGEALDNALSWGQLSKP